MLSFNNAIIYQRGYQFLTEIAQLVASKSQEKMKVNMMLGLPE